MGLCLFVRVCVLCRVLCVCTFLCVRVGEKKGKQTEREGLARPLCVD